MKRYFYLFIGILLIAVLGVGWFWVLKNISGESYIPSSDKWGREEKLSAAISRPPVLKERSFQAPKKRHPKKVIRPNTIKAVYLTSWTAGRNDYIDYVISLAKDTEINAVVIDVKDYSGYVAYDTDIPEVKKYNAKKVRIKNLPSLIEELHKNGIYTIARIVVFQDPVLARTRPDLAVHSKEKISALKKMNFSTTSWEIATLWADKKGLFWIDPSSKEAWRYNVSIAKDASFYGFDEINFDYVRFPSDGDLEDMVFPLWSSSTPKREVIKDFFGYLHKELQDQVISIDLFGLSCTREDDLGIGQIIEDTFGYFDYVCPMVYPSHYESGFLGYTEPAKYPYEVVKYSLKKALIRLKKYDPPEERKTKIRPWLQDFDLRGIPYGPKEVKKEIDAVYEALGDDFFGFMLWSPSNIYTKKALKEREYSSELLFWF
ncbi:putative glycoside hydrolase [bacterium]|nr:putative glycoside hydrolase [bacterium]